MQSNRTGTTGLRRAVVWTRIATCSLLCLFVVLVAPLPASAQGTGVQAGVAAAVRGNVRLVALSSQATNEQAVGKNVVSGDRIFLGDKIETGPGAGLQIMLLDETIFTIGPNAEMVVDKFVYDPATDAGEVTASIVKGAFRFVSGRIAKRNPSDMNVRLPVATIGIRGTSVAGEVIPGVPGSPPSAEVILLGPGAENNADERAGRVVVDNAGSSVEISRPGFGTTIAGTETPPSPPVRVPPTRIAALGGNLASTGGGNEGSSNDAGNQNGDGSQGGGEGQDDADGADEGDSGSDTSGNNSGGNDDGGSDTADQGDDDGTGGSSDGDGSSQSGSGQTQNAGSNQSGGTGGQGSGSNSGGSGTQQAGAGGTSQQSGASTGGNTQQAAAPASAGPGGGTTPRAANAPGGSGTGLSGGGTSGIQAANTTTAAATGGLGGASGSVGATPTATNTPAPSAPTPVAPAINVASLNTVSGISLGLSVTTVSNVSTSQQTSQESNNSTAQAVQNVASQLSQITTFQQLVNGNLSGIGTYKMTNVPLVRQTSPMFNGQHLTASGSYDAQVNANFSDKTLELVVNNVDYDYQTVLFGSVLVPQNNNSFTFDSEAQNAQGVFDDNNYASQIGNVSRVWRSDVDASNFPVVPAEPGAGTKHIVEVSGRLNNTPALGTPDGIATSATVGVKITIQHSGGGGETVLSGGSSAPRQ